MNAIQAKLTDYDGFVEKFKPKLTTDDCYTPPQIYEIIKNWAVEKYGLQGRTILRPFKPGGDYEAEEYSEGCTTAESPTKWELSEREKQIIKDLDEQSEKKQQ